MGALSPTAISASHHSLDEQSRLGWPSSLNSTPNELAMLIDRPLSCLSSMLTMRNLERPTGKGVYDDELQRGHQFESKLG